MKFGLLVLSIFFTLAANSQSNDDQIDMAELYELRNDFPKSIELYEALLENADRTTQYNYWVALSRLHMKNNQPREALKYQTKVQGFKRSKENIYRFALLLKYSGNYDQAKRQFERVFKNFPEDSSSYTQIASCDSSLRWIKASNPPYHVFSLDKFNSKAKDFAPFPVGNKIVFTTTRKDLTSKGSLNHHLHMYDLYFTIIDPENDINHTPTPELFKDVNTKEHEAMASFTNNGNQVFFTRSIKGKTLNGVNQELLNIYFTEKKGSTWTTPTNAFEFNSDEWSTGHPSVNEAGDKIVFMSDAPKGFGQADLYYATKNSNGKWSKPSNLGSVINTPSNELFPQLLGDTLFFASDGHLGMGRLDVYRSIFNRETQEWSTPENLRYPINTVYDDFGFCPFGNSEQGFFCSNRPGGDGSDDIYMYSLNHMDRLYVQDHRVSMEKNRFFANVDARLEDSSSVLTYANGLLSFYAKDEQLYNVQFLQEEIIENNTKVVMKLTPNTIAHIQVQTFGKPIELKGILAKDSLSFANQMVYVLQNDLPVDSIHTNAQARFSYQIPGNKNYSFVAFTEDGLKKFKEIKYSLLTLKIRSKNSGSISDAEILCTYQTNSPIKYASNMDGIAQIPTKAGQTLQLQILKEGFFPKDTSITFPSGIFQQEIIAKITLDERPKMALTGTISYKGKPIENAVIDIIQGNKVVAQVKTDALGNYKIPVFDNEEYNMVVNKSGLFTLDTLIKIKRQASSDTLVNMDKVAMSSIETNKEVTLNNVYFDYNSFVVNEYTKRSLEKLLEFLIFNPKVIIEVNSHTDARGKDDYNMILSRKRVEAIKSFLVEKGISPSRLIAIGMGESKLVIPNATTEEEHKVNRRTNFKVVSTLDFANLEDPELTKGFSRAYIVHLDNKSAYISPSEIEIEKETPTKTCLDKDNTLKYFIGPFNSEVKAQRYLELAEGKGFNDAFIQVFDNGKERAYEVE